MYRDGWLKKSLAFTKAESRAILLLLALILSAVLSYSLYVQNGGGAEMVEVDTLSLFEVDTIPQPDTTFDPSMITEENAWLWK